MHLLQRQSLEVTEVYDIGEERRNTTLAKTKTKTKTKQTTIIWYSYWLNLYPELVRAPCSRPMPQPKTDSEGL